MFVSSTSRDLRSHRIAAGKAVKSRGYAPILMEYFQARSGKPVKVSTDEVARADAFVGLYGWRYGYIPDGHTKSITEQELDKAEELAAKAEKEEKEFDRFCFVSDEDDPWFLRFLDREKEQKRLRARVLKDYVVAFFRQPKDVRSKVRASLLELKKKGTNWQDGQIELVAGRDQAAANLLCRVRSDFKKYFHQTLEGLDTGELAGEDHPDLADHPLRRVLTTPAGDVELLPHESLMDPLEDCEVLAIVGDPGAGKTTQLFELGREIFDAALRRPKLLRPIPVVLQLSRWDQHRRAAPAEGAQSEPRFEAWAIEELHAIWRLDRGLGRQWLEDGELVLLLDGLDEIESPRRRAECARAIATFGGDTGFEAKLVVTCDAREYEALAADGGFRHVVRVEPLSDEQVEQHLRAAGPEQEELLAASLDDEELRDLMRTPLFLNLASQAYRNAGTEELNVLAQGSAEERLRLILDAYVESRFEPR